MWSYGLKQQQLKFKDVEKRMDLSKRYCSFESFVGNLKKRRPVGGCGAHVDSRQAPAVLSKDNKAGFSISDCNANLVGVVLASLPSCSGPPPRPC